MKKIKSSAIYYALFLSIVFGLLLGGFILFSGFNQNFSMQMEIQETLMDNAQSGLVYGQANFKELRDNEPVIIRLFNEGVDSVEITKKSWGAFTVLQAVAIHRNRRATKIAMLGGVSKKDLPNFYLADNGRPLSLCGNARIEGNCFVPKAGLKRAFIEGKNYQGNQLIYGSKNESNKQLPSLRKVFLESLEMESGEVVFWEGELDSQSVSFQDKAIHYLADDFIDLTGVKLKGQIIIEARDSIFVARDSQIENSILKSDVVYIEAGFSGTAQIFASRKIVLEDGVQLKYPSVVGLVESVFPTVQSAEIMMGENSQIIGSVFMLSTAPNFRRLPKLSIAASAEIDGLAYCQGKTELKGTVKGHLLTNKLYLKTASSSYENHLLDGQILAGLPKGFVTANLLEETGFLKRICWVQ